MTAPTKPTYFTVVADYKSVVADALADSDFDPELGPITATVTFTPLLADGEIIAATKASPRPIGYVAADIVARIDTDGKLKLRVEPDGRRLTFANYAGFPATPTAGPGVPDIYHASDTNTYWKWDGTAYVQTFSYTPVRLLADTALLELSSPLFYRVSFSNVTLNGKHATINSFTFQAPNSDLEYNLIDAQPVPGALASGITKIGPTGVRLTSTGEIVFTFNGVDLPDPLPMPAGTSMAAGVPGPQGPPGIQGGVGPTGPAGARGEAGPAGPAGRDGKDGAAGPVGATGPAGKDGSATGVPGPAGATGPAGRDGIDGAAGATGSAGPKGDKGDTGAAPTGCVIGSQNGTTHALTLWVGTQAQYDALSVASATTVYVVTS